MSSIAIDSHLVRVARFYQASIGKKVVMALTGVVMFGYLAGHLAGNLQVYAGAERMDNYAAFLHSMPVLLWVVRALLLVSIVLHIVASLQLTSMKLEARPAGYVKKQAIGSSYASRTMIWSGAMIAAFVIYHILDLTTGAANTAQYQDLRAYENLVHSFRRVPVSAFYIIGMVLLGMHLYHGLWSIFQTAGFSHPRYTPAIKRVAAWVAILMAAGFISIPIAVLTGLVGSSV
ncbi:MAG TPA: succinate dehydrogenase cytochrome b subunit [Bryobacteraceae bacterium]|nr:succinate dehydrogenase cytochrome b subunit [Bryobacteraceae bacterium]